MTRALSSSAVIFTSSPNSLHNCKSIPLTTALGAHELDDGLIILDHDVEVSGFLGSAHFILCSYTDRLQSLLVVKWS